MKRWKRGAAMLLCLCMMTALLAGCGRGRSGESTASVVMTGSVSTVDPAYAATPAERTLVLHLFDNLYRWTAEGAVPAAAHAYDCTDNEDGTQTYTFHLRRDGKWSDGSDVTAADFVYAWRRLTAPETDSQEAEILSMVAGYEDAYAGDPEATAAAIKNGWLFTGDMGALDADGYLTLKDRSKDLIISGGSNIYPREVEEALLTADGVAEVAVVGEADAEWGENVVAFVVAQAGAALTEAALDAHCLAHIARFKRPKRYIFVSELPKNNYGKVLKTELRGRLRGA